MSNGTEIPGGEAQPAVPAGWYPHPTAPGWEAYWNGVAWGSETRPAQAAVASQPAAGRQPARAAVEPAAQQEVASTGQQPAQVAVPAASTVAAAAATPAAAPRTEEGSDSSIAAILCILGAIVAIAGAFLPMGSSDIVDLADNTMVDQTYGLAVIGVAVIGAIIAVYAYLRSFRTWLLVLLGVVIIAIAAYAGLVGVDDLEASGIPNLPNGAGGQTPDPKALEAIAQAAARSGAGEPSPSTGVFVTGAGGLLMLLGGLGLMRRR